MHQLLAFLFVFVEYKQILNIQTFVIYLPNLDWTAIWCLQDLCLCWAHWFVLNSFDPTWNEGLGNLAGSGTWGPVNRWRLCLLSCHLLFLLHTFWSSECIAYNQSLLHAEATSKQRESHREAILSLTVNKWDNLCSSVSVFLSFVKRNQSCDFDLESYSSLDGWSQILQNLPKLPTMASLNRYNVAKREWLSCLRMSELSPSGRQHRRKWQQLQRTQAASLLCCYKY